MSRSLKSIGVVSFLTLVSRVFGLLRESFQLAIFGAGELLSAFQTANNVPNLFRRLLAEGSLTAALIPTLQHELHDHGQEGTFKLLSKVTSWLVVITGGLAGLAGLLFSHARALVPGQAEKWYEAADLTVLLFPYLALVSISAAFSATLNVFQRFFEPALSPIWLNLCILASLAVARTQVAAHPEGAIRWLCAGWLGGGFLQMIVPAGVLVRAGWRPRFDLRLSPAVREIGRLMTPGIFGTAIYQINLTVSRFLAYSLTDSGVSYLFGITRLMEFPIGVFAVAVSTVVYPLIASHAAKRDTAAMARDFQKGIRLILIINVPAAGGLAVLSGPIVRLIFRHGRVTEGDTSTMGYLLAVMAVALPFFSVVSLMIRTFYSMKDTRTPVRIALVDLIVNIGLSLTLIHFFGLLGLVLASTLAIMIQALLLHWALVRRLPELHLGPVWPSLLKVLAAAAVMLGLVALGHRGVTRLPLSQRADDLLAVLGLIPLAVGVYGLVLWRLGIEGQDELRAVLQRLPLVGRRLRPSA